MTDTIRHQIKRAVFDLQFSNEATAFVVRKKLEMLFHSDFIPVLETVFDQHAPLGQPFYIPRLEIDLGALDSDSIETTDFKGILSRQLVQQLRDISYQDPIPLSTPLSIQAALFHFLQTGTRLWSAVFRSVSELEQEVRALPPFQSSQLVSGLSSILAREESSLRLVYQFSPEFVAWIIDQLFLTLENRCTIEKPALIRMKERLDPVTTFKKHAVCVQSLAFAISRDLTPELERQFQETFGVLLREKEGEDKSSLLKDTLVVPQPSIEEKLQEKIPPFDVPSEEIFKEEVYTRYAGIVLLHPFLRRFFHGLHLLDVHGQFKTEDAKYHAIHVLHFLASGVENPEEHETVLFKILCGYPLATPVERERHLDKREKEEAQTLLLAVIGHWAKLKNTSPDGFRQEFLRREGKIERLETGFNLVVEQRAVDVLLSFLPWSYSIIRLPWMEGPLRVDWA